MYKPSRRLVIAVLALGVVGFAFGAWVLLHPASIFVQPWRAVRTEAPVKGVLLGPYPVEEDFVALKKRGVTTIISLLEPDVPYEKVLLDRERALAKRHGMTVKSFPMGSILGQKFGDNYSKNSKAAAEAALAADGVAYIHCYLGLHRARNVLRYLAEHAQVQAQTYVTAGARVSSADMEAEDRATRLFSEDRFEESLAALSGVKGKGVRMLRLEGWSLYRLHRNEEARAAFARALALSPNDKDARIGRAYSDLARGRLEQAEQDFLELRRLYPTDVMVLLGLGNVYFRQARWREAEAVFLEMLQHDPGNVEAREMLQRVRRFMAPDATPAGAPERTGMSSPRMRAGG